MTDAQWAAWLANPAARVTLLFELVPEVDGVPTVLRGATASYVTHPGDTPASTAYPGGWRIDTPFSERLSIDGGSQDALSEGGIEIPNLNGLRDAWLGAGYVFASRPARIYLGDVTWAHADFRQVFDGLMADNLDSRTRDLLNIKLRDKMERLNVSVTEHKLGGTTPNKDQVIPVLLNEGSNVTPLLVNPATLTYQLHDGAMTLIEEIRDEGLPVSFTPNLAAGTFTLNQAPAGAITGSAAGDSAAGTTVASIIKRLVTGYGPAATRFTVDELDLTNLNAFDASHPQPVGLPISDRANLRATCQQIADSLGAQLMPSRLGQLRLLQVVDPATLASPLDVPAAWMDEDSLHIVARPPVRAAVKLGFNENATVQQNLKTSLPPAHADLYSKQWLTATSVDDTVQAAFKLSADVTQQDTRLLRQTDADAEALRRRDLWKVQRTVYEFVGRAPCLQLELGGAARIFNRRFNLSGGVVGMVIGLTYDWQNRRVTVQVLV